MIVFDGTHPYEALLGALPAADAPRSGAGGRCGSAGSSRVPLGRAGAFDAVLEPGELAESEDAGPTVALRDARPPGRARSSCSTARELLAASEAAAELGLDPRRPTVLVSLGQGAEVREATGARSRALAAARRGPGRGAARRRSPRAERGARRASSGSAPTYPMSRYFAAFDAAVAAAGYNAFHELIALGVPSLFVPMPRDTDDQPARARCAERAGRRARASRGRPTRRSRRSSTAARPGRARRDPRPPRRSAPSRRAPREAAAWLAELAARRRRPPRAVETRQSVEAASRGGGRGSSGGGGGRFFASLPQTACAARRRSS